MIRNLLLLISLLIFVFPRTIGASVDSPWIVYYHKELGRDIFDRYDFLVLDSSYPLPFDFDTDDTKTVLGYLSLGEVHSHRSYFSDVKDEGIILQNNEFWKKSFFVDVRDHRWVRRVIEELIPAILHKGFDGLFLDTLDDPPYLEGLDPKKYSGMTQAAINLVKAIRHHYPSIKIMVNRGYSLLEGVANDIDMVLGECVFADYDFKTKTYQKTTEDDYRYQVELLTSLKGRFSHLEIFTLDYWDPDDAEGIVKIYHEQRKNGFRPYVATVELDRIVPEPR